MDHQPAYRVRAAYCDHQSTDDQIYETLKRITDPLERSWEKLTRAKKIAIKMNIMMPPDEIVRIDGKRQELVDDTVAEAVLRLLTERTNAKLVLVDTSGGYTKKEEVNIQPLLKKYHVSYVNSNNPPFALYEVPGGGMMFRQYQLSATFQDTDAVVSVAKMKNHAFMGITLCCKNLFGLPPMPPRGRRIRTYFHHAIRLPYVLPDLGLITQPSLNIIDALTGQAGCEWGGEGRVCDALIAGDHVIATDTCGMWLMGHEPDSDWPTAPFKRDRNHIKVAAEHGFGTVNLDEIDFETEVERPLADFDSHDADRQAMGKIMRTASEQAVYYREQMEQISKQFRGRFIFLQDQKVIWNGSDPRKAGTVQQIAQAKPDQAVWLKLVDRPEEEGEHYEVYDEMLGRFRENRFAVN